MQSQNPDSSWKTETTLPWVNGANKTMYGTTTKVFGGDSHGYGSSAVDMSSLDGKTVRVQFTVRGDSYGSYLGWFVDDIELNRCASRVPGYAPITSVNTSGGSASLTWGTPSFVGSGVASYRITTLAGKVLRTVPSNWRSATVTGLDPRYRVGLQVNVVNAYGEYAPGDSRYIWPTSTATTTSVSKVRKNKYFTVTGRVAWPAGGTVVPSMPVVLQRRSASSGWSNLSTGTTGSHGTKTWSVRQTGATYYRVVARGVRTYFGSTSAARLVKKG